MVVISVTLCSCLSMWIAPQKSMEMHVWKWDFCSRKMLILFCLGAKKKPESGWKVDIAKLTKWKTHGKRKVFFQSFKTNLLEHFFHFDVCISKQRRRQTGPATSLQHPRHHCCKGGPALGAGERAGPSSHHVPPANTRAATPASQWQHPLGRKPFRVAVTKQQFLAASRAVPNAAPGWNCQNKNHLKILKIVTSEIWKSNKTSHTIEYEIRWERQTKTCFQFLKILQFPPQTLLKHQTH